MNAARQRPAAGDLEPYVMQMLEDAAELELARRSLAAFVRLCWEEVEPRRMRWAHYMDIICSELEAISRGGSRETVICIPPGMGKSTLCSVMWPAWELLQDPTMGILGISNEEGLAARDARRCRDLVRSEVYQRLIVHAHAAVGTPVWKLDRGQWDKTDWITSEGGYRYARGVGGRVTGRRARRIIVDDAIDASAVLDAPAVVSVRMAEAVEYYDVVLASRLDDGGARLVVQQRLADGDLAGVRMAAGARAVVLPLRADPTRADRHPMDNRAEGESLAPAVFGPERETTLRLAMGTRHAAAQLDQAPTAGAGGLFMRGWMRHLSGNPRDWPADETAISVDATFKDGKASDFVVMQVWSRHAGRYRMLDQVRGRMDFRGTKAALVALAASWPKASLILIEEAANGAALISDLRTVLPGVVGQVPKASKYARAQLVAPLWESGAVDLPTPEHAPWVGAFVEELVAFPGGANDDQVDGMSQILGRWLRGRVAFDFS